jgi:hypothetical protein
MTISYERYLGVTLCAKLVVVFLFGSSVYAVFSVFAFVCDAFFVGSLGLLLASAIAPARRGRCPCAGRHLLSLPPQKKAGSHRQC